MQFGSLARHKTLLVGTYGPGLSEGLGIPPIDLAWCRYHLPPLLLYCLYLVWGCLVLGTTLSSRSSNPPQLLGTLGLLLMTYCDVAMVLVGFLPIEIQICQYTVEFYLCELAYG